MNKKAANEPMPAATIEAPSVDDLEHEVAVLCGQEQRLGMLYRDQAAEIAGERAKRGDQIRAAADAKGAARDSGSRISAMVEALVGLADAAQRAWQRRIAAISEVFPAEADQMDRQAEQQMLESANDKAESDRLRKPLEAHDDCGYAPAAALITSGLGSAGLGMVKAPRFERRRQEALSLREHAGQVRVQEPHRAGSVEASNLAELLAAVFAPCTCAICRGRVGLRVTPTIPDIVIWSEQAIEKERRRRERFASTEVGFAPATAPMRLHLEWRNGAIDTSTSRVQTVQLEQVSPNHDAGVEVAKPNGDRSLRAVNVDPEDVEEPTAQQGAVR